MRKGRQFKAGRCYHLVSRVAHRAFFFDEEVKKRFAELLTLLGPKLKHVVGMHALFVRLSVALAMGLIAITDMGCTSGKDKVLDEFKWLVESHCPEERWTLVHQEKDWNVIYRLPDEDMVKIRSDEFIEQGFRGWKKFSGMAILYGGYVLDGDRGNIVVNEKDGSNEHNGIRVYKKLIGDI